MPPLVDPQIDRMRALWRPTLELGMAIEQTYLDWLDQCAAVVFLFQLALARGAYTLSGKYPG